MIHILEAATTVTAGGFVILMPTPPRIEVEPAEEPEEQGEQPETD